MKPGIEKAEGAKAPGEIGEGRSICLRHDSGHDWGFAFRLL